MSFILLILPILNSLIGGTAHPPNVAHALGSPDGISAYTNSLEAAQVSVDEGFTWLEVDIQRTNDGVHILAHPGNEADYGIPSGSTVSDYSLSTLNAFAGRQIDTVVDLLTFLAANPDVHMIIDGKSQEVTNVTSHYLAVSLENGYARVHPHVYSPEHRDSLEWPSCYWVAAGYSGGWGPNGELLESSGACFSMSWARWAVDSWNASGWLPTWVHTINDDDDIAHWNSRGVGVYTDNLEDRP